MNMQTMTIEEQVSALIIEQVEVAESQIVPTANFKEDLGFDSLDQVEFVMAVEEAFGIEISDDDAAEIHTVGQALSQIKTALS